MRNKTKELNSTHSTQPATTTIYKTQQTMRFGSDFCRIFIAHFIREACGLCERGIPVFAFCIYHIRAQLSACGLRVVVNAMDTSLRKHELL